MGQSFESMYESAPSYITWGALRLSGNNNSIQAKFLPYIAIRFTAEKAEKATLGAEQPRESTAAFAAPSGSTEQRLHQIESMMTEVIDCMGRLEAVVAA